MIELDAADVGRAHHIGNLQVVEADFFLAVLFVAFPQFVIDDVLVVLFQVLVVELLRFFIAEVQSAFNRPS